MSLNKEKKIPAYQMHLPFAVSYHADKFRDPFKDNSETVGSKQANYLSELMNYPISMLKFVGTLSIDGSLAAFILAPDNKIYQVKEGEMVGDRKGQVLHIYSDRIEIIEKDPDSGNATTQRLVTMQLKEGG